MRDPGIEPGSVPWQGTILPLNQPRFRILKLMSAHSTYRASITIMKLEVVLQIEDILVGDKQLAKEIMYDMKQAELVKEGNPAAPQLKPAQPHPRQGPAAPEQPQGQMSTTAPASPAELSPRGQKSSRQSQSRIRRSSGAQILA